VLIANELLDAMPVHQVVQRGDELLEVYVDGDDGGPLRLVDGPLSTPRLAKYLEALDVRLEPGWRVEINLAAVDWIRQAATRLRRGFMILIDYGHAARELYSAAHSAGTLTTFAQHRSAGPESSRPGWLDEPGDRDITAHVDFTSVRAAAEAAGMTTIGFLDQTYFLLGLLPSIRNPQSAIPNLKTLVMPGGLGSTQKVLILGKNVGTPAVKGCSFKVRVT
jgi:SAM-dependent MidA family methyltransferase